MKKGILIIIIIAVIVIGIICGISMNEKDKQNTQETNNNVEQNEATNTEANSEVNQIEEDVIQNEIEENIENNTTSSETFEGEAKTEEEKAVQIVKKDYGTAENVKFSVEGIDESGRQVIVVRNIQTTEALAFYFVNVSDSTFTKKEMN